jgi:peptide-methionine (S)-S-oxide reductase
MSEVTTLGGGCYWCLDAFYRRIKGITQVESGYSGGWIDKPSVERVYQGDTGHAEVVQITFDNNVISYQSILKIFFTMHDPTTVDRQGNDVGNWYRSVIFYHSDEQKQIAEKTISGFATDLYHDPIVTELIEFKEFFPAPQYMQDYYAKNPSAGYCLAIIDPKIAKLRQKFANQLAR